MRVFATALAPILLTISPAAAQDHSAHTQTPPILAATAEADPHAGHSMQMPSDVAPPTAAGDGSANAADLYFDPAVMAGAREQLRVENGEVITHAIILDRLEATSGNGAEGYAWDAQGWYGGDINRFSWKSEGEGAFDGDLEHAELQLLYSRAVTPYFDLQGGVRQTYRPEGDRTDLVLGVQGLAPYWFEVEASAYIEPSGRTHVRFETEYDLLITNRLVLQPLVEFEVYGRADRERLIGTGLSTGELGLRLRYEFRREFAPYVGVVWTRRFFGTADQARAAGQDVAGTRLAVGLRTWF